MHHIILTSQDNTDRINAYIEPLANLELSKHYPKPTYRAPNDAQSSSLKLPKLSESLLDQSFLVSFGRNYVRQCFRKVLGTSPRQSLTFAIAATQVVPSPFISSSVAAP